MADLQQPWIDAARASQASTGIPASVTLAQFILESGWGAHIPGNNPFGIKALPGQPTQMLSTHEVINGVVKTVQQPFRLFANLADAFAAHAHLLATAPAYRAARSCLPDVTAFCHAMAPKYATDPMYASKLLAIIQAHNLTQYDKAAPHA